MEIHDLGYERPSEEETGRLSLKIKILSEKNCKNMLARKECDEEPGSLLHLSQCRILTALEMSSIHQTKWDKYM